MSFPNGLVTGVVALCISGSATAGLLPERVERAAQERIDSGTNQTIVIAVQEGNSAEITAFGKLESGQAPDGDTVFEIGSITKTFTATILAREVLAGKVSLDTPVAKLLPGFRIPTRSGMEITLGEIAEQYSGLPRMPTNFHPANPGNPYADYDAPKLKAFLATYELPRDPGASYEYSNLGFGLLGYALSEALHEPYPQLVARQVLKPLGMSMTGVALSKAMRAHLARGYDEDGHPVQNWDLRSLAGAGALRSNASDLMRYLRANMGIDHTPLEGAMRMAHEPRRTVGKAKIGLAWNTSAKGNFIWHNGGTGGYRSFIGFTVDRQRGVIVLTNTANQADDLGFATLDPDAKIRIIPRVIELSSAALDEYVGTYKTSDNFLTTVTHVNDREFAQVNDYGTFRIYPSADNEFFYKDIPATVSFKRGPANEVIGIVVHQNGDHAGPKVSATEPAHRG